MNAYGSARNGLISRFFAVLLVGGSPTTMKAQTAPDPFGSWQGQVQWYATVGAKPDTAGHSVGRIALTVDPAGNVTITASDLGCTGLGIFSPGPMPVIKKLDVTLKGCSYDGYNRRFSGTLLLQEQGRQLQVQLRAQNLDARRTSAFYEVKGQLSRP